MIRRYLNTFFIYPLAERALRRNIRSKVKSIFAFERQPEKQQTKQKQALLYELLVEAQKNVPYYADLFAKHGFDPRDAQQDITAIEQLPYLTKEIIAEQKDRLLNQRYNHGDLRFSRTAGSTGPSLSIAYDSAAADWSAAAHLYAIKLTGKKRTDKEIHLSSHFLQKHGTKDSLVEWAKCQAMNRINIYSHSLCKQELSQMLEDVINIKPYLIQGHPTTLYALANYAKDNNVSATDSFKCFESTGEALEPHKADLIREVFGCKVFNRYGSAEFGVVAHSHRGEKNMRLFQSLGHYETCELGNGLQEFVVTGLRNQAMPLIRYKTGDIANIVTDSSGRPAIQGVVGRKHELVHIEDKVFPTHYFQDIIYKKPEVEEFQIVQKDKSMPLIIRLVTKSGSDNDQLKKYLKSHLGKNISFEFTDFSGLTYRGWREKFSYLVN